MRVPICERLASAIENEHDATGAWPVSIEPLLAGLGERPEALRSNPGYTLTEGGFELDFAVPGAMLVLVQVPSRSRVSRRFHFRPGAFAPIKRM